MTNITKNGRLLHGVLATGVGFPTGLAETCSLICRHAATLHRLDEDACNGHPAMGNPHIDIKTATRLQEQFEKRTQQGQERAEKRITDLAKLIPECVGVEFQGDPRGCPVRLKMSERYFAEGGKRGDLGAWGEDSQLVVPFGDRWL